MKLEEGVTWFFGAVGLFIAGLVWRPAFGDQGAIKGALECSSFIATCLASLVAIQALTAWKKQFQHTERFNSLKVLKDAATDLRDFRAYLLAVERRCIHLLASGGEPNVALETAEEEARRNWVKSVQAYNRAWTTAVVFLSPDEERNFQGKGQVFTDRAMQDPLRIIVLYANAPSAENISTFSASARVITDSARKLCADTLSEVEALLRKSFA